MVPLLELKIVKNRYSGNGGFIFAWDLRVIFLGIPSFKISKKIIFLLWVLRRHRTMYRLFPCIAIVRGVFWLKSVKKCLCSGVTNRIMCLLMWKRVNWGIGQLQNTLLNIASCLFDINNTNFGLHREVVKGTFQRI